MAKINKPMSEVEKQYQPMPGEVEPKNAFTKINLIASLLLPKMIKEFKRENFAKKQTKE